MVSYFVSGIVLSYSTSLQFFSIKRDDLHNFPNCEPTLIHEVIYKNQDFGVFYDLVKRFFLEVADRAFSGHLPTITVGTFGISGPVDSYRVAFKNRSHWIIDGNVLEKELGIESVALLNDFVCTGYGILTLAEDDEKVVTLQNAPASEGGPIACIGASEGLGECFLTGQNGEYNTWPSEGGHCEFAPRNDVEIGLLMYVKSKYNEKFRVSVERICSDRGVVNVYEYLVDRFPDKVNENLLHEFEMTEDKSELIHSMANTDELCAMARDITLSTYGAEAGCAALKWLPYGGLYVCGNIVNRNKKVLMENPDIFMDAYLDKGRMQGILEQVPVKMYFGGTAEICMRGAVYAACKRLRDVENARLMSGVVVFPKRQTIRLLSLSLALGVAFSLFRSSKVVRFLTSFFKKSSE